MTTAKGPDPRALVSDALASAHQLGELHRETLERLEKARAALFEVPYLANHQEAPNPQHAASYQATADMLRRRAGRQEGEHQTSTLQRADWFARRAEIKRTGGIMPRELRTPGERLSFVNSLRHGLLLVWEACEQLDPEDVTRFVGYLVDGEGAPLHGEHLEEVSTLARADVSALMQKLPELLEQLGMGTTEAGERGFFECDQPLTFEDPDAVSE
jgi:hypothetical protein